MVKMSLTIWHLTACLHKNTITLLTNSSCKPALSNHIFSMVEIKKNPHLYFILETIMVYLGNFIDQNFHLLCEGMKIQFMPLQSWCRVCVDLTIVTLFRFYCSCCLSPFPMLHCKDSWYSNSPTVPLKRNVASSHMLTHEHLRRCAWVVPLSKLTGN